MKYAPYFLGVVCFLLTPSAAFAQIYVDSTGSNGFGDLPHPMAKSRFSNTDHEYNLFVRTTGQDEARGVGIYNYLAAGTSDKYGLWNHVEQAAGATGQTFGLRNVVRHSGDGTVYGFYNDMTFTRSAKGKLLATYSRADDRDAEGLKQLYANFYSKTIHRRRDDAYGNYTLIESHVNGAHQTSYGQYINVAGRGKAMRYGLYSSINGGEGYAGYFVGDVHINGVLTQASDEKLKKNIKDLRGALDIVMELQPHTYNYVANKQMGFGEKESLQYGFVAQEVAEVLPELVSKVRHPYTTEAYEMVAEELADTLGFPLAEAALAKSSVAQTKSGDSGQRETDIQGVRYMDMIAVLVGAVQEQQGVIDAQEGAMQEAAETIKSLRSEMKELSKKVSALSTCSPCSGSVFQPKEDVDSGSQIRVYPNPAANYFIVDLSGIGLSVATIKVISADGKTVYEGIENSPSGRIKTNRWVAGTYLIEVVDTNTKRIIAHERLIVQ